MRLQIESARRQLGTALQLFLEDKDSVSIQCLAGNGAEVMEFYAKKAGKQPFFGLMVAANPKLTSVELRRAQRLFSSAI